MTNSKNGILPKKTESIFYGGAEMGNIMLEMDWSKTPLGDPINWPSSLRATVSLMADSPLGMYIAWGKELTQIFNDLFLPVLGTSGNRQALGQSSRVTFGDIWDTLCPIFEKVMKGEAARISDFPVPEKGNEPQVGYFFDLALSPIRNDEGIPAGILITAIETTGKKKLENELKEAKERMEYATNAADIATWVFDPQNETFVCDQLLKDWFGLPEAEMFPLELAMEKLIPQDKAPVKNAIEQSLQFSSGIIDHEFTMMRPDNGQVRILRARGRAVFNTEKIACKLYGILQDITGETLAQRKIKESTANFMNMVLQAPFSIAVLRGPGYVVEVANDKALELWERGREEIMGKPILESVPELADQGIKELLDDVYYTGQSFSATEMPVRILKNGHLQEHFVNFNYQALMNVDGASEAILVIGVNVTDLIEARRHIEESEKRLRSIVENSPFPIGVYTGKEMRIQLANQAMLDTWAKGNDVIGRLYSEVLPELNNQHIFEQLANVYHTGKSLNVRNQKIDLMVNHQLETFYFNYSFTPLFNLEGKVYGVMNTAADVTDLVNAKKKIEKSEEQLRIALAGGELGTFDYYPEENKLIWSDKTRQLFGLPPDAELDYEVYISAIHPKDLNDAKINGSEIKVLQADGLYELAYRIIDISDGRVKWIREKGKVTHGNSGKQIRYTGILQEITKLKEAESEMRKLNAILHSSTEFIGLTNTNTEIVYINPAGLKMLGWDNIKNKKIIDCIYPPDAALIGNLLQELLENGCFNREIRFWNKQTKEPFWLQWNVRLIKDFTSGEIQGLATVSPNITERKLAEVALKESEERFRTMADNISQLAWMTDETGWIFWYNKRWFEYTGTTLKEMEGWGWKKVHHPDYVAAVEKKFRKKIEQGKIWEDTFPLRSSDGNYRWFLSRAVPIKNEKGAVIRWFGTNTDITEIIRFEQELKSRETRFRMFADSMPQIVWAADVNGNLTYINKAFYNYSGLSNSDEIKERWLDIIHPEDRVNSIREWDKSVRSGREFNIEHRFRNHEGNYRWQLSRAVPLRDANGNIETWVATSTDIQEIKELDLQKDHFISIASHELKTPITSIKGYIQILLSTYYKSGDEFLIKSLTAVDKQIVKITNLISDLLDLSKLKLGNLRLTMESFNINELIEEVVEEIKLIHRDYQIEVSFQRDLKINADRERLAQVLINFLTNAIKYSPKNKLIQVNSFLEDHLMTVMVKDHGIGINKKSQEKIFERFYRVEGKNEETYPGFGIGLFISAEIIRRHNGKIGVRSTPGRGSEFYFSIPVD